MVFGYLIGATMVINGTITLGTYMAYAGLFWNVINPLAQLRIYSLVFSQIMVVRIPQGGTGAAFALYLCAGLLPWTAFSECILRGANARRLRRRACGPAHPRRPGARAYAARARPRRVPRRLP